MVFLDSATWTDAAAANDLGFVQGITTNPLLFSRAGARSPLSHLEGILERLATGVVLYQPSAIDPEQAAVEARTAYQIDPGRVGIKLLADRAHFGLARELSSREIPCAMTAVYSPAQALLAHDAGCQWVIPYVDRSRRLLADGADMVRSIRAVLDAKHSAVVLLAASVKSVDQAIQAILDGADDVSVSLEVLYGLAEHELTASAAAEFADAARGFD